LFTYESSCCWCTAVWSVAKSSCGVAFLDRPAVGEQPEKRLPKPTYSSHYETRPTDETSVLRPHERDGDVSWPLITSGEEWEGTRERGS
jgi:hypothetical protein